MAVCTAVYPAGIVFFEAYCRGLRQAIDAFDGGVRVLLLCDDVGPGDVLANTGDLEGVTIDLLSSSGGGAAVVRREMLCAAASMPVDAVACFDMDDIPLEDGLNQHWAALDRAEVSFGDMHLIDAAGVEFSDSFFSGAGVPLEVHSLSDLLDRNFLGFTNTAVRRAQVHDSATSIPDDVIAADWWFYSHLIAGGSVARKTDDDVVAYRTHEASTLGGKAPADVSTLKRQCEIMNRHYARLEKNAEVDAAASRMRLLLDRLNENPEWVIAADQKNKKKDVWFGRVSHLAYACQEAR
jgi:hypothetical protein